MSTATETGTGHLTDAEFTRLLDGAQPGAVAEAHLALCALCRQQFHAVQSSLASFRTLSTAWAEVEAPRRVPAPARWMRGLQLQTSWGAGLAATAITGLLAFWLGVPAMPGGQGFGAPAVHSAAALPTNAEMAADNSLLVSIDQELSEPGSPELSAEQLQVTARHNEVRPAVTVTD